MTVDTKPTPPGAARDWLMQHLDYAGDDCLIWPFSRDPYYGRGRIGSGSWDGKRTILWAHRLMCELVHGSPPTPTHQAAHNCGNGSGGCVNPKHLAWKTNSENQLDRRKHGTQAGGKGNRTKLTPQQIEQIRLMKGRMPQIALAELIGCKRGTIEYWQRTDHAPVPPGTSASAIRNQRLRAQRR